MIRTQIYLTEEGKKALTALSADALMAATAIEQKAELKTLNTKHYPMFKGLKSSYTKK